LSENFENNCFRQIIPHYLQTQLNNKTFIKFVFPLANREFCLTGEFNEFCAKNVKVICVRHCHGSSLDLTLGHVTIDIRVEGAILVHSEGAILVHSEKTFNILGRSHPSFTRLILG
jgi:hypothetical protein